MPLCKAWTSLFTDQLRLFIAGFPECWAARYVALTEPAEKPRVRSHRDDNPGLQGRLTDGHVLAH